MVTKLDLQNQSVTIIGGAGFSKLDLNYCLANGPTLISADGGANNVNVNDYKIDFIIGDLDSLIDKKSWTTQGAKVLEIEEQETTDFEKCLYSVNASIYFCVGFIGGRSDHFLAACSSLAKYHYKRAILVGSDDIIFHLPKAFEINLPLNTRISLFPMQRVIGLNNTGLRWSISGLEFDPSKCIGTSNITIAKKVTINLSKEGMLIILPRSCLPNALKAFKSLLG